MDFTTDNEEGNQTKRWIEGTERKWEFGWKEFGKKWEKWWRFRRFVLSKGRSFNCLRGVVLCVRDNFKDTTMQSTLHEITNGLRLFFLSRAKLPFFLSSPPFLLSLSLPLLLPLPPLFSILSRYFYSSFREALASRTTDIFRFAAWVNGNDHSTRNTSRSYTRACTRVNTRGDLALWFTLVLFIGSADGVHRHGDISERWRSFSISLFLFFSLTRALMKSREGEGGRWFLREF